MNKAGTCRLCAAAMLCIVCAWLGGTPRASAQVVEGIAAVVNDEAITYGGITERVAPAITKMQTGLSREEMEQQMALLHLSTLQAMVEEKLLQAEGAQQGNEAFDKYVNQVLQSQIEREQRAAGGRVSFMRKLKAEGLTYAEHVKSIRAQIVAEAMVQRLVRSNLSVSPAEMREYYRAHADEFTKPGTTTYRQIFISVEKHPSRVEAKKVAEEISTRLAAGEDFAALATEKSDGPRASAGGLWDPALQRPKPIEDLISSLSPGTVSRPVETDIGFTIIKVEARTTDRRIGYEEAQVDIRAILLYEKQLKRYQALILQLEEKNYVSLR